MRTLRTALALVVAPVLALALAGCGSEDGDMTLTVYAASSLTAGFEQIAEDFEAEHDGVDVVLSLGGSSDLATQIQEGAPADVFASADTATMAEVEAAGLTAAEPEPFATNTLQIVVPAGNPGDVASFADLARPGLRLVVCAPEVPCGAATRQVADEARVTLAPVSEEQSVTDVLAKVASGEADAGVVYVTDVAPAGDAVEGIAFPESDTVVNTYPIAPIDGSDDLSLAEEFVAAVLGETGQTVLADLGFGPAD
ncbi:MAG: molybdate ABC transporter substrate-binding protein [Nocardioides sp.]